MVQTRSGATYQTSIHAERAEALRKTAKRARDESAKADEEKLLQQYAYDYFRVKVYPPIREEKYKAQEISNPNPALWYRGGHANLDREWANYQGKAELYEQAKQMLARKRERDSIQKDIAMKIREERNELFAVRSKP